MTLVLCIFTGLAAITPIVAVILSAHIKDVGGLTEATKTYKTWLLRSLLPLGICASTGGLIFICYAYWNRPINAVFVFCVALNISAIWIAFFGWIITKFIDGLVEYLKVNDNDMKNLSKNVAENKRKINRLIETVDDMTKDKNDDN